MYFKVRLFTNKGRYIKFDKINFGKYKGQNISLDLIENKDVYFRVYRHKIEDILSSLH